jgi:hypothetical protein
MQILLTGTERLVRENPESFMLGGCCCWGDERDPQFFCSKCNQHYYHDLKPVVWDVCGTTEKRSGGNTALFSFQQRKRGCLKMI